MSYVPAKMRELQVYLAGRTGLPMISLGVVGNAKHTKGYHLGKDRIYDGGGPGIGDADYSVKTARDKAGLTNAAQAIDIGNFADLRKMSRWLVTQGQKNAPGTRDIREIIYSPDGRTVLRWDRARGYTSAPRPGEADNTHLTHTHVSFYRDSEKRDKVAIFAPFFEGDTEDAVKSFQVPEYPGRNATPKEDPARPGNSVWLYSGSDLKADGTEISLKPIRALQVVSMEIIPGVTALAYEPTGDPDEGERSKVVFVARTNIARSAVNTIQQPNCTEVVKPVQDALLAANGRIATIKGKLAAAAADIAND